VCGEANVDDAMRKTRKIFYGWWIVSASAVLNFFIGGTFFYGFTVFFNPIRESLGWSAATTSVAFIFQRLEVGILGPVAGFVVDRIGPRKMMLGGWSIIGLGFLFMSRINSLWAFYGTFLFIAIGISFGSFIVMNAAVVNWFSKKRSRAMTLVYVGFGVSGILVPVMAWLIERFGWRTTLLITGIGLWIICLPLCLIMRHRPEQYGYRPDGETSTATDETQEVPESRPPKGIMEENSISPVVNFSAKAALRTRTFWLLSFTFFFQHIATSAIMVHIVPYLESVKVPTAIAASAVTGMTLCSLMGRLSFGFLGDFTDKRYLIAMALTLQTIGVFIFSFIDSERVWLVIPFLLFYAPGYGGPIPLRPALQADYFGTRNFGTIMGLMTLISMLGGLFSPVFAGWVFDTMGSYSPAWRLLTLTVIPGIPLVLLAKPPQIKSGFGSP